MLLNIVVISLLYLAVEGANLRNGKPYYDLDDAEQHFNEFLQTYNKSYETEEEFFNRFEIFQKRLNLINHLNEKHESTTFAVNAFSDWTEEERSGLLGYKTSNVPKKKVPAGLFEGIETPDTIDWRDKNVVTPVRDQGRCASCWAFSAVAVIESQVAMKHKKLLDLAEQQILDCDTADYGCYGGLPYKAFDYLANNAGGIMLETDYPYTQRNGECVFKDAKLSVNVSYGDCFNNISEEEIASNVANYGPVSVALHMSKEMFHYSSGILTPDDCGIYGPNHAVTIVGYGTESGTPYWLIKNSWGTGWGDKGYFKLIRGKGVCQINYEMATVEVE